MEPGELIRRRREAHGLTQARLAIRAGTTQAALSRLERGVLSPSVGTVRRLLACLGEELDLESRRTPAPVDPDHLRDQLNRTPAERLILALSWNRLAGELGRAGERARR